MFNTKLTFKFFADYDRSGIIEYLDKMAAKGWILKSKNGVAYKFVRTDKTNFRYDATYFADADKENDWMPYKSDVYFEMAQAGGWQFLTNDRKMMIFITENTDAVQLETDPINQVEVIHQSMLHSYLPQKTLLAILWLWLKSATYRSWMDGLIICFWVLIAVEVIWYIKWYLKAKKMADEYNSFYETKTPWIVLYVEPIIMLIMLAALIIFRDMFGVIIVAFIAYHVFKDN